MATFNRFIEKLKNYANFTRTLLEAAWIGRVQVRPRAPTNLFSEINYSNKPN